MLQKIFKLLLLILLTFNFASAQQECPQFNWVEKVKYYHLLRGEKSFDYIRKGQHLIDKEGNSVIALLLGPYAPTRPHVSSSSTVEIAGNLILIPDVESFSRLLVVKLDEDLNLLWHNSLILTRNLSDSIYIASGDIHFANMCLDRDGNIYIAGEAKGVTRDYNDNSNDKDANDRLILQSDNKNIRLNYTHSITNIYNETNYYYQEGFLLKLNKMHGFAFWLKNLKGIRPIELQMNVNDNMYLAFKNMTDTIEIDNQPIISDTDRVGIAHMNTTGDLQWLHWGNVENVGTLSAYYRNDISISSNMNRKYSLFSLDAHDNVYTFGLYDTTFIKINASGQVEWRRHFPINSSTNNTPSDGPFQTLINSDNKIYLTIPLYLTYDFGNNITLPAISPYDGTVFLWELDATNGQTTAVSKLWDNDSTSRTIPTALFSDDRGYLYVSKYVIALDSFQLGDSIYNITNFTHPYRYGGADAFISKIQLRESQDVDFLWTVRSEGTGYEFPILSNSSINGAAHYFYAYTLDEDFKFGDFHFIDTIHRPPGHDIGNEVTFVFGKVNTDCSLNADELENPMHSISIYPNPANTQLTIGNLPLNSIIHLSDLSGRKVYTQNNKSESMIQIPLQGLVAGMYFVSVINDGKKEFRKVVVNE